MLGLYALSASFSADAFDSTVPEQQIQASLPALLSNLSQPAATLMVLNEECVAPCTSALAHKAHTAAQNRLANIDERTKASTSKENKPFQRIPLEKRKAPSFRKEHHGQVEKEKQSHDVMHQSLLVLRLLIQRSKAKQMECILATTLDWLDQRTERWENVEWCCWLAQTLTRFSQIQHRFGIVSALLDKLTHTPQEPQPSAQQVTLLSMITAVLTGPTALLGLGLGEVLTSFVGVIAQRATYGLQDPFLPALIDGTASLASRLYYLDQISDLVQDIILALRSLPLPSKDVSNQQRSTHGVAVLKCLIGVLERSPHLAVGSDNNRSHISPELWSKSLFLCTDPDPAIRFTYSHALLLYIRHELPATLLQQHDNVDASSARKELFDALALAAYKLALSQFTAEKPTSSSSSSTRSNRSASHPPDHSKGTTSPPANENAAAANLDDFAALQQVMLASVNSASPEATLSLIPMLSALLSSGQTLQPELTAVYRELISSSLTAAIAAWSDATPTSFEKTSAIPPLRSLEDGASNGTLAELALTHNGPSEDAELPSVEDLAKSSKLQEATKCSFGILLATLKEPWTAVKAAEHSELALTHSACLWNTDSFGLDMGVRTRPIASPASNTRLKSPSQASFKNPSVSDLRASLIVTGPAHLHVDGADGSPATIKRHSHQRTGTPDSLMVQGGSQTSPRRSIATASPASPSGTAEATVSPSRAASPSKPSPLRA